MTQETNRRVAVVTGASRGIGRATAERLARDGFVVVINYASSAEAADEVRRVIEEAGGSAVAIRADVSKPDEVRALFAAVDDLGTLEVLVNNAGVTADGLCVRMSDEAWKRVLDVNLYGAFLCSREAIARMMKARKGSIVNVSSIVGLYGNAGQANYAASKAGIIGLTKSLAREVGKRGIRVNAVAPGFIQTEMTASLADRADEIAARVPLGRLGEASEVAEAVAFLCSDAASYITGAVLEVSGGLVI
jgi:3-oxoacyl-[acyl-carrier protein] reductase